VKRSRKDALKTLNNIYKHFKEKHPDIIEQVKEKLTTAKAAP